MSSQPDSSPGLPLDELKLDFVSALASGSVVVEAPTGSGKSTRLPLWALELGRVLVVEPRRLVCRSLARYLAFARDQEPGQHIGYATRYENVWSKDSHLLLVTPGIALRWYAADALREFQTVILDEFHERRWDVDLLLAMLRAGERQVVLTSATFAGRSLAAYVQGKRLTVQDRNYPVSVRYLDDTALPRSRNLAQRVHQAVRTAFKETSAGDVLVFLPGRGEIQAAKSLLDSRMDPDRVIPLHAGTDTTTQDRVLSPDQQRRVILATNVAETSLTIPSVRAVVDSGLERRTFWRNGRTVLGLSVISQAAADQRAGRAGRLGPGLCLRLWSRRAKLEPSTPPEICREDLSELVLMAAACGHQAQDLHFPDSLPGPALEQAQNRLQGMQALDASGRVTTHGQAFISLPVDPLLAHLVMSMPDAPTQAMMIDLAAALSAQGQILPRLPRNPEILTRFAPEACDALTLIRCLRTDPPSKLPVHWAPLREAQAVAAQLRRLCHLPELSSSQSRAQEDLPRENFLRAVLTTAPELLFARRVKRPQAMGNDRMEVQIGEHSRMPDSSVCAAVFDLHSIPAKGTSQTLDLGTCLAPVPLHLVAELDLGTEIDARPVWEEGQVYIERSRALAGRTLHTWWDAPQEAELCRAVSRLILDHQLLTPAGEQIQEEVQAWNLAVHVGFCSGEQVQARAWLSQRLRELGLEQSQDLELLDPEDLRFPGIPDWEREEFERRFPRRLRLENMEVEVDYNLAREEVLLRKTAGIRKTPPTRRELPAWNRKWTIRFRDKSRTVNVD